MGFDVGSTGLRIVLDAEVPAVIGRYVGEDVDLFLADHGLTRADIGWWVCHPGGPKVIDALQETLGLTDEAVALTRRSLAQIGNLSSASVLHVLEDTLRERPPAPGSHGLLMAMGPGFCSELVLLRAAPVTSLTAFTVLVVLVGVERLAELVVSKRNAAWSLRARRRRDRLLALPADGGAAHRAAGRGAGRGLRARAARAVRAGLVDAGSSSCSARRCAGGASRPSAGSGTPG